MKFKTSLLSEQYQKPRARFLGIEDKFRAANACLENEGAQGGVTAMPDRGKLRAEYLSSPHND